MARPASKRYPDDLRGVLAVGVREAAAQCARAGAGAIAAYRVGRKPRVDLSVLRRPLAESALYAYLLGMKRARQSRTLRLSARSGAVKLLAERLEMPPGALRRLAEAFDAAAVRVLRDATDATERRVEEALQRSTEQGLHVEGGVAELREAFRASGLTPRNSFTLEAIYRTQTQQAYGAAQWHETQQYDELWGYRYVTVGDNRVRESHAAMEGVTLPRDHPAWDRWAPPNGWACRCILIPLFREEPVVEPPPGAEPDEGFAYNPGEVFAPALAAAFDESQPRAPAGSPEGGQWTEGSSGGRVLVSGGEEHVRVPRVGDENYRAAYERAYDRARDLAREGRGKDAARVYRALGLPDDAAIASAGRKPETALPERPFVAPPRPRGHLGGKKGGYAASGVTVTMVGDLGESVAARLGLHSLLEPGIRQGPLDARIGDCGFEVKAVTTGAAEYKVKMNSRERNEKLAEAKRLGLKPCTMMVVLDKREAHVYWREGIGNYRLNASWHYAGRQHV